MSDVLSRLTASGSYIIPLEDEISELTIASVDTQTGMITNRKSMLLLSP